MNEQNQIKSNQPNRVRLPQRPEAVPVTTTRVAHTLRVILHHAKPSYRFASWGKGEEGGGVVYRGSVHRKGQDAYAYCNPCVVSRLRLGLRLV
jgi:hypothetical protein